MIVAVSLAIAIIGLGMFWVSANPKITRVGEMMFFVGLLAFLVRFEKVIDLLPK